MSRQAPRRAYRGAVTQPPQWLFGASPNAPVCAQAGAVLVGVRTAARVGTVAVDIDAIRPMSPRLIAVAIARAAVAIVGGVAVGIGPGATASASVGARKAGTTASSAGRTRKTSGPGTRRSAGTSETRGPADAGRSMKASARRTARTRETGKTAARHTGRRSADRTRRRAAGRRARKWLGQRDIWRDVWRDGCRAQDRARGQDQQGLQLHRWSPQRCAVVSNSGTGAFATPSLRSPRRISRSGSIFMSWLSSGRGLLIRNHAT